MSKEILKNYSKYCPRCKAYLPTVYLECPDCRGALGSSQTHYLTQKIGSFVIWVLIFSCLWVGTYGVQKNERINYRNSVVDLFHGQLSSASDEFGRAFSVNPAYLFVTDSIVKITQKFKPATQP